MRTLISPTSIADRARTGRRLAGALAVAVVIIVVLVVLGPSARDVERRFTPYGAEGPLRIMPEISIDQGQSEVYQRPDLSPRHAAPQYEIIPEPPVPHATEVQPPRQLEKVSPTSSVDPDVDEKPDADVEVEGVGTAELLLPRQTADQAFIIKKMVRPIYPLEATEAERRLDEITVEVGVFVTATGSIQAVMISRCDGGPAFERAVRTAMQQWEFEPVIKDGKAPDPRWLVLTWKFRGPYRRS